MNEPPAIPFELPASTEALPQSATLRIIAARLRQLGGAEVLWLGGSLARGEGDLGSDIDLRCAAGADALGSWLAPSALDCLSDLIAGSHTWPMGESAALHHALLSNGQILDLWVQSVTADPPADVAVVLASRNEAYSEKLRATSLPKPSDLSQADPQEMRQAIVDFWINSLKHEKVLNRGLEILAIIGLGMERNVLLRLWHIEATGLDADPSRGGIHVLARMLAPIESQQTGRAVEILGSPLRNRAEIEAAIELNREEVAKLGRELASRYGFDYPDEAELSVRASWLRYKKLG